MDEEVLKVLYRLKNRGNLSYLCGGGVRDLFLGTKPKDFDVATDARPGRLKKLFANSWLVGKRFRIVHVVFKGGRIVEVTTFRRESEFKETVGDTLMLRRDNTFGTPCEDALRRDFTINAVYYNISDFSLIDYVGGVEDLQDRIVRCIGDPDIRFQEDPLRIMRGIRFAAHLGFNIEENTWEYMKKHAEKISQCAPSRVQEDLVRLMRKPSVERGYRYLEAAGVLPHILPELSHIRDEKGDLPPIFWHALALLDEYVAGAKQGVSDTVLWATVLYWPIQSATRRLTENGVRAEAVHQMLTATGTRLNISKALRRQVGRLIQALDVLLPDRGGALLRKGWMRVYKSAYFDEAVDMAHIVHTASGGDARHISALKQEMARRSTERPQSGRRRRRRGRKTRGAKTTS